MGKNKKTIGQTLREWRVANKLKQETVAEQLGVTQAAVSRLERDLFTPHIKLIAKVSVLTGVKIDDFDLS